MQGGSPTHTLTPTLAAHDHHLMSEDTVYLNLPRVASPDTITTQREGGGDSHTPVGPAVGKEDARWLQHLRAGDLFNLGPISIKQSACVTAVIDHFYPASECDVERPHTPGF